MKLGIITYAYPHLKTEQIILNLLLRGEGGGVKTEIIVYAFPFIKRQKRDVLIEHRPNQQNAISPDVLCKNFNLKYVQCDSDKEIDNECEFYLITGSGILSADCVRYKKIINCHPGIIPAVRGLDAFKWAIFNMQPVGNTLHYIDENIDSGEIISIVQTPIFITDSLETFARRHYEMEINILSNFHSYIKNPVNKFCNIEEGKINRRMDITLETKMCRIFDEYKNNFVSKFV